MENKIKSFFTKYWIEVLLFVVLVLIIFWRLGKFALADWDEAIYADIARNVLHGNFLTLKWGAWNWFQKPPFYMWVEAGFFKLFGVSEFSARLTSALSGLGLSYLIYLVAKKLFNKKVAIFALFTVLLNTFLLAWFRFATTDIFALFLNTLAIYYFWLSQENKKYLLWCFVILGLAGMIKGPVVVAIGLTFLIYLLFVRQTLAYLKSKYFWIGMALFLLILLPWHLYMIHKFGSSFINEYFIYQIFTRAKEPIEGHVGSWLHYPKLILKTFPLCLILIFSFFISKKEILAKKKEFLFLAIWLITQYFSIARVATVLDWYILPVFVPLQILSAAVWITLYQKWKTFGKIFLILTVLTAFFAEFWKPYSQSWTDVNNSKNQEKECFLEFKKINQNEYYFYGYDLQLPTILFYLQSINVNQMDSFASAPKSSMVLVNGDINPQNYIGHQVVKKLDGCVFVKN